MAEKSDSMRSLQAKVKSLEKKVEAINESLKLGVDITEHLGPVDERVRKLEADLDELSKRINEGRISPEAAEAKVETAEKKVDELAEEVKEAGETAPQSSSEAPAAEAAPDSQTHPPAEEPAQAPAPEDDWPLGATRKGVRLW